MLSVLISLVYLWLITQTLIMTKPHFRQRRTEQHVQSCSSKFLPQLQDKNQLITDRKFSTHSIYCRSSRISKYLIELFETLTKSTKYLIIVFESQILQDWWKRGLLIDPWYPWIIGLYHKSWAILQNLTGFWQVYKILQNY